MGKRTKSIRRCLHIRVHVPAQRVARDAKVRANTPFASLEVVEVTSRIVVLRRTLDFDDQSAACTASQTLSEIPPRKVRTCSDVWQLFYGSPPVALGGESTIRDFELVRATTRSTAQVRTEVPDPPKGL